MLAKKQNKNTLKFDIDDFASIRDRSMRLRALRGLFISVIRAYRVRFSCEVLVLIIFKALSLLGADLWSEFNGMASVVSSD